MLLTKAINIIISVVLVLASTPILADPFPPIWGIGTVNEASGPIHFNPAAWPAEPSNPKDCGVSCGQWQPYTRFQGGINDPRVQDPSNGGTAPQNYVNISSSCIDKTLPSIYYYLAKPIPNDQTKDVIMFRWRVEQIANNYATGPSAGNYGATDPWSSALWTVLFDLNGDGYRDVAAHLNGSSGDPSHPIDLLAGIWGNIPTQSIDYVNDPSIKLIAHNPTAFTAGSSILNFNSNFPTTPNSIWPSGSTSNSWDYGTSRSKLVYTNSCTEYFVDYQIPVRMLDASSTGPNSSLSGPKITRDTPLSMLFCTANSLNNPFQKDCALNRAYVGDASKPAPFGDYLSFNKTSAYAQPIISSVTATAPSSCSTPTYQLTAKVQDTLYVNSSGIVLPSIKNVKFYYWYDKNGDGTVSGDTGSAWTYAVDGTLQVGTLNTWNASWNASSLLRGRYLIGVQAVDDKTLHDDGVPDAPVDNRTFSYIIGSTIAATQAEIYSNAWSWNATTLTWIQGVNIGWLADPSPGQQSIFPSHSPTITSNTNEDWYGNPDVTGTQIATTGIDLAINSCGVAPTITKAASSSNIATSDNVTFTITIGNTTGSAITLTQINDVLPSGFTYQSTSSITNNNFSISPSSSPSLNSSGTINWILNGGSGVSIANNTNVILTFVAKAGNTSGSYNNSANAATSFGNIISNQVPIQVDAARISLSKTPNTYLVNPGNTVTYTLNYSNDSSVTVTNATLTDTLPTNVSCTSYTINGGSSVSCSGTSVSISLGTLAGGATGSVTLIATVAGGYNSESLTNSATLDVLAPDGNTHVTQTATSTIAVNAPTPAFTLIKTSNVLQIAPSGSVTWTISYKNYGSGSASGVQITDAIPSGFTYTSSSCAFSGGTPSGASCSISSGTITWNFGSNTIPAGASGSVTFSATAANPFLSENPATNTATINWTNGSPVSATNSVGVTGTTCRDYYFSNSTTDVDASIATNTQKIATATRPLGTSGTIITSLPDTTNWHTIGDFYQDPSVVNLIDFSGATLDTYISYTKSANGKKVDVRLTVWDFDPSTNSVNGSYLAQTTATDNGAGSALTLSISGITHTIAKNHRLYWQLEGKLGATASNFTIDLNVDQNLSCTSGTSCAHLCSGAPATLSLAKTVDQANIASATGTLYYVLSYANTGGATASGATLVDNLPSGLSCSQYTSTCSDWNNVPTSCSAWTDCSGSSTVNLLTNSSLAAGASGKFAIQAAVGNAASGTLSNNATLSATGLTSATASASTIVGSLSGGGGTPSLTISKKADKTLISAGDIVTYTLTVVNTGGNASSIDISDTIPNTNNYLTYVANSISRGDSRSAAGNPLTWHINTLNSGASAELTFQMQAAATGIPAGVTQLNNLATLSDLAYCTTASVSGCTSNTVTVSLSGNPNLILTKNASDPVAPATSFVPGDIVTYTLSLANNGSTDASSVSVNDPIPANLSYYGSLSAVDTDTLNGAWTSEFDAVNNQVSFTVDKLSSGKTATLSFQAKVISSLASGTTSLTNTGSVSASNAITKSASVIRTAIAAPIISISKNGPTSIAFPAATLSATATNATTLYVNSTANLTVGQYIKIGSSIAQISALTANSITTNTQINASSGSNVIGSANFDLSYKNTGNTSASNVIISDALPSGWLFINASPTATSFPAVGQNGTVSWTLTSLAAAASGTVQITAIPTAAGNSVNTATITDANYCLTSSTHVSCNAALTTIVGGLQVSKSTSTATRSTVAPNNVANYTISVSNTTGATITSVQVDDILPQGFTYKLGTTLINNSPGSDPTYANNDTGHPIWSIDIPGNSQVSISFQADIASTVGAATYQNNVTLTKVGVGITPFDPLLTTAEDVTVLSSGTGLVQGVVYKDNNTNGIFNANIDSTLAGIAITILDKNGVAYVVYTDSAGYFSRVVPAGSTIIDVDNATLPAGLTLTTGTDGRDPSTVIVPDGGVGNDNVGYVNASGPLGSINGRVWNDMDANQAQNASETGLLAVQVILRDNSGNIVATAYTDNLGNYSFPNLAVGNYSVDVVPISGYFVTTNNDPAPLSVTNGGNSTANFGLKLGQTLSGTVFNDNGISNGTAADGLKNGGEVGTNASGLNVVISDSNNHVLAVTSVNADGSWSAGVPSGSNYSVVITTANPVIGSVITPSALLPNGWGLTAENINSAVDTPHDGILTSVNATSNLSNINFGITTIAADLSITKSHTGNFTQGQSSATYTLTVSNNGSAPTSGTVTVTDTLPSGLVKTAIVGTGWNCVLNTLTCTRSDALANGHSYEVITVTVDVAINASASLTNNAQVSLPGEANTSNNSASDITTITSVASSADMSVSIQGFPNSTNPFSTVTGSVTCTNLGPDAATNASCAVSGLPGGASISCSPLSPQASLANGASIVCSVSYTAPASGSVTVAGTAGASNDSNANNNNASLVTTINAPTASLSFTKTVYQGHNNGAGCPGLKELVVVDLNHPAKPVTWCFSVQNTGTTYLTTPILSDPLLNINQSALTLKSGSLPLAPGATAIWYYEESRSQSLTNIASVSMTASNSSGTSLNLASVQGSDTVSTVFAYIFDPPFGLKTSSFNGVNVVRWTMVWINDSPIIATGVVITDPPPVGMSYVANTITCSPQGITTVSSCSFEAHSVNYPRGRVLVTTNMGPDMGATNAATANNELLVSFDVTVPVAASSTTYLNQGQASWDPDPNDNVPPLQGVTNDPANGQGGNSQPVATPIIVPPQNHSQSIPTLSEWAIFVVSGFILLMGYYRLRRS